MKQTPSNYTKQANKLITQIKKLLLLTFDNLAEVIKPSVAYPDGHGLEERIFEVQKESTYTLSEALIKRQSTNKWHVQAGGDFSRVQRDIRYWQSCHSRGVWEPLLTFYVTDAQNCWQFTTDLSKHTEWHNSLHW